MEAENLDVLVLGLPKNVPLLSGFWPMIGASNLIFPVQKNPVCIIPDCYEKEAISSFWEAEAVYYQYGVLGAPAPQSAVQNILTGIAEGKSWKPIGFEGSFDTVAPSWNRRRVSGPTSTESRVPSNYYVPTPPADPCIMPPRNQRLRKTSYSVGKIRKTSEISCFGLQTFESKVEIGVSEVELAAETECSAMTSGTGHNGGFRVRAFAQLAVGPKETLIGYRPNEVSTTHRLQHGDTVLLERGVIVDGYWADKIRVRVAREPSDEQFKIFETVRRAQEAAVAEIKPGIPAAQVDEAARSVLREAGYGEFSPHVTGHRLGFRYHESSPILALQSDAILDEGNFISVEPGIYGLPWGGFRIEGDVLVTKTGAEVLGPFPKNLV